MADNPPQVQQPTRAQFDNGVLIVAVVLAGLGGLALFSSVWSDVSPMFSGWHDTLQIEKRPSVWARHEQVEWECEDLGTIYAYRYLDVVQENKTVEFSSGTMGIIRDNKVLNRSGASWRGMYNLSDRIPTLNNKSGIYAAKTSDSPILRHYRGPGTVLVKLRLSGRIIEADYGYRAHKAEIVDILEHIPE